MTKRIIVIIAAVVVLIIAYQQIPHIVIGERAQGSYERGTASDTDVAKSISEAQEATDKAGRARLREGGE